MTEKEIMRHPSAARRSVPAGAYLAGLGTAGGPIPSRPISDVTGRCQLLSVRHASEVLGDPLGHLLAALVGQ